MSPRWELMNTDDRVEHLCRQMDDVVDDLKKLEKTQHDIVLRLTEIFVLVRKR
jgi:hypothetical protein